jgi:hypothetical protein
MQEALVPPYKHALFDPGGKNGTPGDEGSRGQMSKAADLAAKLMTGRVETVETLKDTPAARLGLKNQDGRAMRSMMRIMHDHEMSHVVQVQKTRVELGAHQTEAQMILAQTIQARAALAAAIVGMSDEEIDRKPAPDQWSVSEIVEHVLRYDPVLIERFKTQFPEA